MDQKVAVGEDILEVDEKTTDGKTVSFLLLPSALEFPWKLHGGRQLLAEFPNRL